MNGSAFDHASRLASESRRSLLASMLAATIGWHTLPSAEARKKGKHKKRKGKQHAAVPNAFGCVDVGAFCQSAEQCCSGICEGNKGKQTCRAHDVGGCAAGAEREFCGGSDVVCTTSAGAPGFCVTTTGNAGFCATFSQCYPCRTDLDCQLAGGAVLGPRAACMQCAECETGTGCATRDYIVP